MASPDEILSALRKADAAGDIAGAKVLADAYRASARQGSGKSFDVGADGKLVPSAQNTYGPESQTDQWFQAARNVGEGAAKAISGFGAGVYGDAAGIGAIAQDAAANVADKFKATRGAIPHVDPAALRSSISQRYTYQPSSADSLTQKVVDAPGAVIGGAGEALKTGVQSLSPNPAVQFAGDVAGAIPLAAASYLGVKGAPKALARGANDVPLLPQAGKPLTQISADAAAVDKAKAAGYKLTPTQTGAKVGSALEGISGQAALERALSQQNAKVTNRLAAKEIGLPDNAPITAETLAPLKAKANSVYSEVSRLGKFQTSPEYQAAIQKLGGDGNGSFPLDTDPRIQRLREAYAVGEFDAADAVQKTRKLRSDAVANIKAPNAPEQNALGYAQRAISDALESELQRRAAEVGKGDLVTRFQAARQQLAKIHSVEAALSPRGNVSAGALAKQLKRGTPLSGGLKTAAETAQSFQKSVQDVEKIRHNGPFSVVDYAIGAGAAIHNPLLAASVVSRPLIRAGLASDTYQGTLARAAEPRNALVSTRRNALPYVARRRETQ